jgi:hypothetical protein
MKYVYSITFLLCVTTLVYADNVAVEALRTNLLQSVDKQAQKISLPAKVVSEFKLLVKNDLSPIDIKQIESVFIANNPKNAEEAAFRQAYIIGLLFRERNNPVTVTALFPRFSFDERIVVIACLEIDFKQTISNNHLFLIEKGLNQALLDAQDMNALPNKAEYMGDIIRSWIKVAAATGNPKAAEVVRIACERDWIPSILRFNMVAQATHDFGSASVPLARWYFERHAWTGFQVSVILETLRKYDHPTTVDALISNKRATLSECLRATTIEYQRTPATQPEPAK